MIARPDPIMHTLTLRKPFASAPAPCRSGRLIGVIEERKGESVIARPDPICILLL